MAKKGTLCWFDIPFDDKERADKFYSELFGWTFQQHEASPIEYQFALGSADAHSCRTPHLPHCCGGLMARQVPGQPILLYFKVDSIDESCKRVTELGGAVICPKQLVPGHGAFAVIKDTEGNVLCLWETAVT